MCVEEAIEIVCVGRQGERMNMYLLGVTSVCHDEYFSHYGWSDFFTPHPSQFVSFSLLSDFTSAFISP